MSSQIIQITELSVINRELGAARAAWQELLPDPSDEVRLYERIDGSTLLEIRAYESWPNLGESSSERQRLWDRLAPHAAGDFRREILVHIEEPKPTNSLLPNTHHLELRYVEVRPLKYADYRSWRERTIFDVIRNSPEVATFSAYHTVFTTRPGVLFLSGFDSDIDTYLKVFSSDRYREIIQAAGDNYITGGNQGLDTRIYSQIERS